MPDPFGTYGDGLSAPAARAVAVTPHDTNELTRHAKALYVGGAGNIAVTTVGGDDVTFTAVPAGSILPVRVKIVKSTGTSATSIVALS